MIQTGLIHVVQLQCNDWEEQPSDHQASGSPTLKTPSVFDFGCACYLANLYNAKALVLLVEDSLIAVYFHYSSNGKVKRIYGFADTDLMKILRHCST